MTLNSEVWVVSVWTTKVLFKLIKCTCVCLGKETPEILKLWYQDGVLIEVNTTPEVLKLWQNVLNIIGAYFSFKFIYFQLAARMLHFVPFGEHEQQDYLKFQNAVFSYQSDQYWYKLHVKRTNYDFDDFKWPPLRVPTIALLDS